MPLSVTDHVSTIAKEIYNGKVVFFLGAGINMSGRPKGELWTTGKHFLPKGDELARALAKSCGPSYELQERRADLARVAQYVKSVRGLGSLYDDLHPIFDQSYPPTHAHEFLAKLPGRLRPRLPQDANLLVVTTNYDDVLECAFSAVGEPFELANYIAEGQDRGRFRHIDQDGSSLVITEPNKYLRLSTAQRSVIMKVHGTVNRGQSNATSDDYVITEDDYLHYITHTNAANLFPVKIIEKIKRSHILFLGYGLRDWNFRVLLRQIWADQRLNYASWAIQIKPDILSEKFWAQHDVQIIDSDLDEFVEQLGRQLETLVDSAAVV